MKTRIISAVIIGILTVGLGIIGGIPLAIVLAVCSLLGYYEMVRVLHTPTRDYDSEHPTDPAAGYKASALDVTGLLFTAAFWIILMVMSLREDMEHFVSQSSLLALLMILGLFLVNMTIYVLTFPKFHSQEVINSIFAFVYVPVMISCIYRAEFLPTGRFVYALIFFCSWISDSCAWIAGKLFGKHKMAPVLSPKKTIEGAVGGIAGSMILCFLAALFAGYLNPGMHVEGEFLIIGFFGGLIGIIGDLAASAIKRNHNIKDYGKAIPGHGGIMDRFDSTIFVAPVIYYLGVLLLVVLQ